MPTIEQLEALLEQEPDDTFLNFGLAMALAKEGRTEDALLRFDRTLAIDARYIAAYFQKGRVEADAGDVEAAQKTLRQGISIAEQLGDTHAKGEMTEYLESLA